MEFTLEYIHTHVRMCTYKHVRVPSVGLAGTEPQRLPLCCPQSLPLPSLYLLEACTWLLSLLRQNREQNPISSHSAAPTVLAQGKWSRTAGCVGPTGVGTVGCSQTREMLSLPRQATSLLGLHIHPHRHAHRHPPTQALQ